jgi:uncharacterized protein YjbI with pentapeptide repeats
MTQNAKTPPFDQEDFRDRLRRHETWLQSRGTDDERGERLDLEGRDLSECYLPDRDQSDGPWNLSEARLDRADFHDWDFGKASLAQAKLTRANLQRAKLSGCDLRGANFSEANLSYTQFIAFDANGQVENQANLDEVDFSDAQLEGASFQECTLRRVNLHGAVLKGAILNRAQLEECQVERADLQGARGWLTAFYERELLVRLGFAEDHNDRVSARDFSGYNLAGVRLEDPLLYRYNFDRANLEGAQFEGCTLQGVSFQNANLARVVFNRCHFETTEFTGANLFAARFSDSSTVWLGVTDAIKWRLAFYTWDDPDYERNFLERVNLPADHNNRLARGDLGGYSLENADLSGQKLDGWNFSGAQLKKANFTSASLRGADFSGAQLDNTVFTKADLSTAKLSGAILKGASIEQANLQEADFKVDLTDAKKADLTDAKLAGSNLSKTNLTDAILIKANLSNCDLREAILWRADLDAAILLDAVLRDADLQNAKLATTQHLRAEQLAGTNLNGATLPDGIALKEIEGHVAEASKLAQTGFLTVLATAAYTWLAVGTTKDPGLLTNALSFQLPIIGAQVPVLGFYYTIAVLLLALATYFQIYLQRLVENLSALPAIFPDGRSVDRRVYPWQLSGLVRAHFPRLQNEYQPLALPQRLLSMALAWWSVPVTLVLCWFWCLFRQDWRLTGFQLGCLILSIALAWFFQALAVDTFRGRLPRTGSWVKDKFRGLFSGSGFHRRALILFAFAAVLGLATLLVFSIAAVDGRVPWFRASFEGSEISTAPLNWISPVTTWEEAPDKAKEQKAVLERELRRVKGAELSRAHFRRGQGHRAFLVNANLLRADLRGADFKEADLRSADLRAANLHRANLADADLTLANLGPVDPANEGSPDRGANLSGAKLQSARLVFTQLMNADLCEATLMGGDLRWADLRYANLRRAVLGETTWRGANLQGADLRGVHLHWDAKEIKAIKEAQKWEQAIFDVQTADQLGIPIAQVQKNEKQREDHLKRLQGKGLFCAR